MRWRAMGPLVCHSGPSPVSTIRVDGARGVGILDAMKAHVADGPAAPPEFRRIARAIEFVAANARQQPSLADIAAAANWSEYHFAREFRRWTGISPKQWLQQLSLTAAKQALDDERSVLQAAIDAGLSGPGRLHDLFVTLEAVTPGEYKSRGRGLTLRSGTAQSPFGEALIVRRAVASRSSRLPTKRAGSMASTIFARRGAMRIGSRTTPAARRIADTIWRAARSRRPQAHALGAWQQLPAAGVARAARGGPAPDDELCGAGGSRSAAGPPAAPWAPPSVRTRWHG